MANEYTLRKRRQELELAQSNLHRAQLLRFLRNLSIVAGLLGLFGSLVFGPLGLIPEGMAWGVGVMAPLVFGGIAIGVGVYLEDSIKSNDLVVLQHKVEDARETYYDLLKEPREV